MCYLVREQQASEGCGSPAGSPGTDGMRPRWVAAAVTFLCSPAAEMVRGQTLVVDGGFSLLA